MSHPAARRVQPRPAVGGEHFRRAGINSARQGILIGQTREGTPGSVEVAQAAAHLEDRYGLACFRRSAELLELRVAGAQIGGHREGNALARCRFNASEATIMKSNRSMTDPAPTTIHGMGESRCVFCRGESNEPHRSPTEIVFWATRLRSKIAGDWAFVQQILPAVFSP